MSDDKKHVPYPAAEALRRAADAHDAAHHAAQASKGPARVTSEAYRNGWQTIFGRPVTEGQA